MGKTRDKMFRDIMEMLAQSYFKARGTWIPPPFPAYEHWFSPRVLSAPQNTYPC